MCCFHCAATSSQDEAWKSKSCPEALPNRKKGDTTARATTTATRAAPSHSRDEEPLASAAGCSVVIKGYGDCTYFFSVAAPSAFLSAASGSGFSPQMYCANNFSFSSITARCCFGFVIPWPNPL